MLYDRDLPLFLWVEACSTAVYLQNRSPHRAVGSRTLEEAFIGRRLDIGHLRMFGCLIYSHVPFEKRTKLEPTTKKGILMGYNETTKGYRIYLPAQRKLVVKRDVRFEEDQAFRKSVELRDCDLQALEPQQDLVQGAVPSVAGAPGTGTFGTLGSGVS